jgi:Vacuole effluxer Atg22 like
MGYSLTLFQSLAFAAGYDPTIGPGSTCSPSGRCVLPWGGGTKSVSSVVLISNGVSFAVCCQLLTPFLSLTFGPIACSVRQVMTLIFTTIGSAADYGSFGRWLLFVLTCICWGAQFASMSLTCTIIPCITRLDTNLLQAPSRWPAAMALYMIGFITYGATLVFYAAVFPRLARNTAYSRALREKYELGQIEREEYEREESLEKNRISNISTVNFPRP